MRLSFTLTVLLAALARSSLAQTMTDAEFQSLLDQAARNTVAELREKKKQRESFEALLDEAETLTKAELRVPNPGAPRRKFFLIAVVADGASVESTRLMIISKRGERPRPGSRVLRCEEIEP